MSDVHPVQDVICRLKWDYPVVNLAHGTVGNCCRTPQRPVAATQIQEFGTDVIMNLPEEIERRRENLRGIAHRDCNSCLNLERAGAGSPREGLTSWVDKYYHRHRLGPRLEPGKDGSDRASRVARLTEDESLLKSRHPRKLEIVLGNTCHLQCVYCSPAYSTQWARELGMAESARRAPTEFSPTFWRWFYEVGRHHVRCINLLGGEPTYMPLFYEVLDRLSEAYEDLSPRREEAVKMGIVTNLASPRSAVDRLLARLPRLHAHFNVHLQISLEAVHKRAEYIRRGLKWEDLTANLAHVSETAKRADGYGLQLGFVTTLNALAVAGLPDFLHWVLERESESGLEFELLPNIVTDPAFLSPLILPAELAPPLLEAAQLLATPRHAAYRRFLEDLHRALSSPQRTEAQLRARAELLHFLARNDLRSGRDAHALFPELLLFK
jgi:hypothetical protein